MKGETKMSRLPITNRSRVYANLTGIIFVLIVIYFGGGCSRSSQSDGEKIKAYGEGMSDGVLIALTCTTEPMVDFCNSTISQDRLFKTIKDCIVAEVTIKTLEKQ